MRLVVVLALVGCYSPSIQPGTPCGPDDRCPGELTCDTNLVPPTCVDQPTGVDAAPPDTPPACAAGCPADQPICDGATGNCRGCLADRECGADEACHELAGTCVATEQIVFVAPDATGATCTADDPCDLDLAASQLSPARPFVRIADGTYTQQLRLDTADGFAVIASGVDTTPDAIVAPVGRGLDEGGTIVVEGIAIRDAGDIGVVARGTLVLSNVEITGSRRQGLDVRNGATTLRHCRIEASENAGITLTGGDLDADGIVVANNAGGGIDYPNNNSQVTIRNSVLADNGSTQSQVGGIRVQALNPILTFEFNTVVRNRTAVGAQASGLSCNVPVLAASSILADNVGGGGQIGATCSARFSLFNPTGPSGNGNKIGAPMFDAMDGFHLLPGSPARDAADPSSTLAVDIDGEPRPGGSANDIGADEIP